MIALSPFAAADRWRSSWRRVGRPFRPGNPDLSGLRVAIGLMLFATVWLTHLSHISLTPPIDNIEQLNWLHSLEWGYYKHPPLPTWLIWLPAQVFGATAWTSYLSGAGCTIAAVGLLWWLLAQMRGRRYATLALMAVLCIPYYNARLSMYNHDTLLALLSVASAGLCWKAFTTGRLRWWIALGVALGLGMMAKYQIAVTMASLLFFWVSQRGWRYLAPRRGLLVAALIALVMFLPHVQWLRDHDFGPIRYALGSSLDGNHVLARRLPAVLRWLFDQLFNRAMPAWVLLAAAVFVLRRRPATRATAAADPDAPDTAGAPDMARALVLCFGLVPLGFMALISLLTGAHLQLHWGSPFLLFAVPAVMEMTARHVPWQQVALRSTFKTFATIQLALLLLGQASASLTPGPLRARNWHTFDSQRLANEVELAATPGLPGGVICVISGPSELAGAVALHLKDRPLVLIDGRYDHSPWVDPERVRQCGLLQLQRGPPPIGGTLLGPLFPGLYWRVVPPAATATSAIAPVPE